MADDTTTTVDPLTVPMNTDGTIGTLPEPLQKFLDRRISEAVQRVKAKAEPTDPVEREKVRQLEAQVHQFQVAEAEREQRYEEALKLRETEWQKHLDAERHERERRDGKLLDGLKAEIRAAAVEAGARVESLPELGVLLSPRLTLNALLDPVVLGDDGQPSDLTIAALVSDYLDHHPHHRKASAATGGGARGGASTRGTPPRPEDAERESAFGAMEDAPTAANLNKVAGLIRQRALRGG